MATHAVTNAEALKTHIHNIHNGLRNQGAGYGQEGLKVFWLFYGIKKIEESGNLEKVNFNPDNISKFNDDKWDGSWSHLLHLANAGDDQKLAHIILNDVLDRIISNKLCGHLLFYEIPKKIKPSLFSWLIREIDTITEIEESCNVILAGKIYEYFVGRDETAISELGAYFTNRGITSFVYEKLNPQMKDKDNLHTMIDPFGGSGGFTIGYVQHHMNKEIDWSTNIHNVFHYDMNGEVIKTAGLEFFSLTGEFSKKSNLGYKNSFNDEFGGEKFHYVITNPPYGGDKMAKSENEKKNDKIICELQRRIKHCNPEKHQKEHYENQIKNLRRENRKFSAERDSRKVTLKNSSKRIQAYAKEHNLKGNDKESISAILMMDLLEEGGTACGVLIDGLFSNGKYSDIRECLLNNFNVKHVITIPSGEFENTSTVTGILIFSNTEEKTTSIKFSNLLVKRYTEDKFGEDISGNLVILANEGDVYDHEEQYVTEIPRDRFTSDTKFSFNYKIYQRIDIVANKGFKTFTLDQLCDFNPGQKEETQRYESYRVVKIKDMTWKGIEPKGTVSKEGAKKKELCEYNDIILSGTRPKATKSLLLTEDIPDVDKVAFDHLYVLRPKIHPMLIYSSLYLSINDFETHLCGGSLYPKFDIKKLYKYPIVLPNKESARKTYNDNLMDAYKNRTKWLKMVKDLRRKSTKSVIRTW